MPVRKKTFSNNGFRSRAPSKQRAVACRRSRPEINRSLEFAKVYTGQPASRTHESSHADVFNIMKKY